jgi:hypothetical protein
VADELVGVLVQFAKGAKDRAEFRWADQIAGADVAAYRSSAEATLKMASADAHSEADWFSAFGSELIVDDDDKLEPTPFDMTVARQRFLADAAKLVGSIATGKKKGKAPEDSIREVLFGPWRYEDDQHSLGWDPSTARLGAYSFKAPTEMTNAGVRSAVWLALESLPLFPCFCVNGELRTRGLLVRSRAVEFCWPVWRTPISLSTLKSLLALKALTSEPVPVHELEARGIVAVYRSRRAKPNKYLVCFQPALLCAGPFDTGHGRERRGDVESPGGARVDGTR